MELNEFESLSLDKRKEIVKQGSTNILWFKILLVLIFVFFITRITYAFVEPYYNVWNATMEAKAELAKIAIMGVCK